MKKKKYIIISILTLIVLVGVTSVIMVSKKNDKKVFKNQKQIQEEQEFIAYKKELARKQKENIEKAKKMPKEKEITKEEKENALKEIDTILQQLSVTEKAEEREKSWLNIMDIIESKRLIREDVQKVIDKVEKNNKIEEDKPYYYTIKSYMVENSNELIEQKEMIEQEIEEGKIKNEQVVEKLKNMIGVHFNY